MQPLPPLSNTSPMMGDAPALPRTVMGGVFGGVCIPSITPKDTDASPAMLIIWAHGWGQDHRSLRAVAEGVAAAYPSVRHLLLDLPGFGGTPPPPEGWGTDDYARAAADLIKALNPNSMPVIWIGHSFGGRVGIRLAANHMNNLAGLVLIGGAGLKRRLTPTARLKRVWTQTLYRTLTFLTPEKQREALRQRFGSSDYRNAGALRSLLVRVVSEDLAPLCPAIPCPTVLIYGENDTETPPEFGERFACLIPKATLHRLPHHDHYSVLTAGRPLVIKKITAFMAAHLRPAEGRRV